MKSTKQNYALKQLQKAMNGGVIVAPDKAKDAMSQSVQSEVANLRVLRVDIVKAMVTGLAPAIANGTVKGVDVKDLVDSANTFAHELLRLECEEIEAVLSATKGKRSPGFEYLCAMLGVEPHTEEEPVNLHA